MADERAGELERLHQGSQWKDDEDLVFAHPATGGVQPKANITRRMRAALKSAGLDEEHRFHDLRHTFGTAMAAAGRPAAHAPGVAWASRPRHHPDLRRLQPERA
jgi:integrase